MMSRLFLLFVISLMYACTTEADQPKSSNTKLYFSYRICEKAGKCKNFTPTKRWIIISLKDLILHMMNFI